MAIYLLKRLTEIPAHDVVNSMVVRARSSVRARHLAATKAQDEKSDTWLDPRQSSCNAVDPNSGDGVLCVDAQNG